LARPDGFEPPTPRFVVRPGTERDGLRDNKLSILKHSRKLDSSRFVAFYIIVETKEETRLRKNLETFLEQKPVTPRIAKSLLNIAAAQLAGHYE